MDTIEDTRTTGEQPAVTATVRTGTQRAFALLTEPHRRELRIHCYRMVANLDDAEDLVQDTFLRAWRSRSGFQGRSTLRAWLYTIATNACLDSIKAKRRRVRHSAPVGAPGAQPSFDDVPWLQPMPDHFLADLVSSDNDPEATVIATETIELAFLAAVQFLAPRQRAALVLRDVLDWTPEQTAHAMDTSVAAANSAVQRARSRMEGLGRPDRADWKPLETPTDADRDLVRRYIDAHERAEPSAVIALLDDDIRFSMPPFDARFDGIDQVAGFFTRAFGDESPGEWRLRYTQANGQPAAANYIKAPGASTFDAVTLDVLRVRDGRFVEITTFDADVFAHFGLPTTLLDP